ncbi:hypothetical protein MCUN1_003709 [Malassezia cuniculi]|uniref:Endonuclease/exonuclease/phosphatase domain-containing protein n=1 Tax=Malassezia cuniculi TaxID=948313 RepID=A0AAF0EX78_9BASI|nr:hypothetical protein MCUN1_003709 [Malassezia cuniculi]
MPKPTPEEIERLRAERAAKNAAKQAEAQHKPQNIIYERQWIPVSDEPGRRVRVVSWNILAQGLVRRSLFPGSDCLKVAQRIPLIAAELCKYDWDIGCFQEVDCVKDHAKALRAAGYEYTYNKGYDSKQHGLMIAWRARNIHDAPRQCFCSPASTRVICLDDAKLNERTAGCSRLTRNIGLFAALPYAGEEGGVIVATTHLFWHPRYRYERARQVTLLVHELECFRNSMPQWQSWPVIFAGDFNDQPHSPTYTLVTGKGRDYADVIDKELGDSRVIDASVDIAAGREPGTITEGGDPDRVLDACRLPEPDDGLLYSTSELIDTCGDGLESAYGSMYKHVSGTDLYFMDRKGATERYNDELREPSTDPRETASYEPKWTLYSSLFRLTLDYIFAGKTRDAYPNVTALLSLHPEQVLSERGIPKQGVCASDHIMIGAEYAF